MMLTLIIEGKANSQSFALAVEYPTPPAIMARIEIAEITREMPDLWKPERHKRLLREYMYALDLAERHRIMSCTADLLWQFCLWSEPYDNPADFGISLNYARMLGDAYKSQVVIQRINFYDPPQLDRDFHLLNEADRRYEHRRWRQERLTYERQFAQMQIEIPEVLADDLARQRVLRTWLNAAEDEQRFDILRYVPSEPQIRFEAVQEELYAMAGEAFVVTHHSRI